MEQSGAGKHVRAGIAIGWGIIQGDSMDARLAFNKARRASCFFYEKFFRGVLTVIRRDVGSPNGRNAPKPA